MKINTHHEIQQYPQDLHIHTVYSKDDGAIESAQTIPFIADINHSRTIGISDHFEHFYDIFDTYHKEIQQYGFRVGTEVDGARMTKEAANLNFEYYIYHCRDEAEDYKGLERLLATEKPVIIAHPMVLGTDFNKLPDECFIEINNRYIWKNDWQTVFPKLKNRFRFVLGSDAHKPSWLNQQIARYVARELEIEETLLFE